MAAKKTGRPTKYSGEILKQARAYLQNYESLGDAVPSVAGLSVELGVCRKTLYNWAAEDEREDFLHTLGEIESIQERVCITKGLKNEFNAAIVKLMLANHGYSDRKSLEHSGPGGQPLVSRIEIVAGGDGED
jgi:hypothetical protein